MTRRRHDHDSARNARRFLARRILYEADGELRIYELPEDAPVDEAIAQFEKRFHVREDPDAGVWRRVAATPEKGARHGGDA